MTFEYGSRLKGDNNDGNDEDFLEESKKVLRKSKRSSKKSEKL